MHVKKQIEAYVIGDRDRFLVLKAQGQAWKKNLDMNLHVSIIAIVISIITLCVTIFSNVAGLLAFGQEKIGQYLLMGEMVLYAVLGLGYGVWGLSKIIKFMGSQEDYNYIILCLEEYEKEYFTRSEGKE